MRSGQDDSTLSDDTSNLELSKHPVSPIYPLSHPHAFHHLQLPSVEFRIHSVHGCRKSTDLALRIGFIDNFNLAESHLDRIKSSKLFTGFAS